MFKKAASLSVNGHNDGKTSMASQIFIWTFIVNLHSEYCEGSIVDVTFDTLSHWRHFAVMSAYLREFYIAANSTISSAQVGVLEEADQVSFAGLFQSYDDAVSSSRWAFCGVWKLK